MLFRRLLSYIVPLAVGTALVFGLLSIPDKPAQVAHATVFGSRVALLYPRLAMGATVATAATTTTNILPPDYLGKDHRLVRYYWEWTSNADGDDRIKCAPNVNGILYRLITVSYDAGDLKPADNYDVYVRDTIGSKGGPVSTNETGDNVELATDMLGGSGANRSNTDLEVVDLWDHSAATTKIIVEAPEIVIENAGAANQGTVILYMLRDAEG